MLLHNIRNPWSGIRRQVSVQNNSQPQITRETRRVPSSNKSTNQEKPVTYAPTSMITCFANLQATPALQTSVLFVTVGEIL